MDIDAAVIEDYALSLRASATLPPVVGFFDGANFWLADGFHRYHAHLAIEADEIPGYVHEGTKRDAVLYSVGANHGHGLRRSNEDKRKAVMTLLEDAEWPAGATSPSPRHAACPTISWAWCAKLSPI